ncbi:MAG: FAD-binding protein [Candidatus Thiodiazotropha sp. (ex Dulcina madagascariensis)]|nr:FAD-binding protein [Candidatus Thiodiazotropha sp. (ex Dulcina madagascariensis)]MCU7925271.1 FAD-binding protein [Candidatus Thiodiazotropha sp. (ex Dulcina madagascariensis)]
MHDRQTLARAFQQLLPSDCVIFREEELIPYECDGLSAYRRVPLIVLLPYTADQVEAILKFCHRKQIPVVARGAGTGLSGGALPHQQGVLLSLARLNKILEINAENMQARVQPGVRNLAVSEAARPHGLYYAPDPSSQIACSIGGNVAENAGGVHCLKYGLTLHNVLQLTLITIDGEKITLGTGGLDAPGLDLLTLITGSEGMLGVVVEVRVKLLPIPTCQQVVLAAFDDVETAANAVAEIIAHGILPAGLEMMDNLSIRASEDFVHAGYPTDAEAILLCEVDGVDDEVAEEIGRVRQILLKSGAAQVRTAADEQERIRFWAGRKNAFPAVGRLSPDYYCMDGTIPRSQLGKVLKHIGEMSDRYGLRCANVFHAGDGNLHPLILYDANIPGELEQAERFGGEILELCVAVGGTITGEHGVGVEKINQMCAQFTDQELETFHAVKAVFDPHNLLNPGKAIPTLNRCAEFGAMHVHAGKLRFPELERF